MQIQILGTGSSSVFLSAWVLAPEVWSCGGLRMECVVGGRVSLFFVYEYENERLTRDELNGGECHVGSCMFATYW